MTLKAFQSENCERHTKFDIKFTYTRHWTVNEQRSCFKSPEIHRVIYNKSTSIMEKHRTIYDKRTPIMEKLGSFLRKSPLSRKTWVVYKKNTPITEKVCCIYFRFGIIIMKDLSLRRSAFCIDKTS